MEKHSRVSGFLGTASGFRAVLETPGSTSTGSPPGIFSLGKLPDCQTYTAPPWEVAYGNRTSHSIPYANLLYSCMYYSRPLTSPGFLRRRFTYELFMECWEPLLIIRKRKPTSQQECDGTRRPESWDAPDWLSRGSVFVKVYHISVLQQNEYCFENKIISSGCPSARVCAFAWSFFSCFLVRYHWAFQIFLCVIWQLNVTMPVYLKVLF
jgi:hypothetical protein